MSSPTQWTWVWASSRSWWWTGRPDMLPSMGLQRLGHYWMTEPNWIERKGGIETEQNPVGPSQVQKPLCVSCFLIVGKDLNLLGLPWVSENRLEQLLTREVRECRNKGKAVRKQELRTSLPIQWLELSASNAGGPGAVPVQGTRSRMPQLKELPCCN